MKYKLTDDESVIIRTEDKAFIPVNPDNADYKEYLYWVSKGNTPGEFKTPEEREQDRIDRQNERIKNQLEIADIKIIRAIIEQNQARIDAYKEEQRLRRLELIPPG